MAARAPLFGQEGKLGSKNSLAGLLAFPLDPRERHRRSRLSDLVSSFGRSRVKTRGWFVVIATPTVVFGCLFFDLLSHCRQAGGMKQRTQFFGSKWRFCGFMNGRGLQSEICGKKFRRHPRAQVSWLKAQNSCRHWDWAGAWFCGCAGARKQGVGGSVWGRNYGGAAAARRVRGRGGAAPATKSNIHAAIFSTRSYGNLPEEGYLATMRGGTCSMSGPLRSRQRLTERGRPLAWGAASPSGTALHGPAIWSRPLVSAVVAPVALRDVRPPPPRRVRPSVRASRPVVSLPFDPFGDGGCVVSPPPRGMVRSSSFSRRSPPRAAGLAGGAVPALRPGSAALRVDGSRGWSSKGRKAIESASARAFRGARPPPSPTGRGRCRWLPG